MMFLPRALCALLLFFTIAQPCRAEEPSLEKFAVLAAAEQFLLLLDQGEYEQCWENASELFRQSAVKYQWQKRIGHLRDQYGALNKRQLRYSKAMQDIEGAPAGKYFFLIYGSSFADKGSAIETMTMMKASDGLWRVSGYTIK